MTYRSLDALRGIAALGVVLFHSPFVIAGQGPVIANASLFVDFFFVLSGFVMASAYRARIADGFPPGAFVALRLGRLYPLHLAMIVPWLAYVAWTIPAGDPALAHHLRGLVAHLTMLNSVGLQDHLSLNYPAWSVGAEFWGCMVFFAVVAALGRRFTGRMALGLAVLCYAALVLDGAETLQRSHDLGLVRCLAGFFLGVALQMRLAGAQGERPGTRAELAAAGAVIAALALPPGLLAAEFAAVLAFVAAVAVFARSDGALARALQARGPVFLGRISYSVYMVHALVLLLAADAARGFGLAEATLIHPVHGAQPFLPTPWAPLVNLGAVAVIVALSAVLYRYVEAPARAASRRRVAARWGGGPSERGDGGVLYAR